ncbi:MAG TPA: DUF3822 family protein [Cytophagaceae bacterium]|jgi:hypothetical protein
MSEQKNTSYRLNKKIKDDNFNVDLIGTYGLSLQINHSIFRFCVTDSEKNRCLLLEDYELLKINSTEELISQLELIFDDNHILKAGYWKEIKLAIKNPEFSLIPDSLFDKKYLKEYLSLNCQLTDKENEEILYYRQNSTEAVNIFKADGKIIDWFLKSYPYHNITVIHHTSSLIEGLLQNYVNKDERSVFAYIENKLLTLVVVNNRKLEYCNSFQFISTEDFVYYVMLVYDQLQLDPNAHGLTLWGDIAADSPIHQKLYKYIRHLKFGNKPKSMYFGYHFDEIFDHSFFDLYNMHLCE